MDKEDFFSKLNIKDYNNQLENILENKSFSEGTKNILLNILYKVENAYEDYNKIKADTNSKKDILQEILCIIEKKCKEIELVKPTIDGKTKLGDKKFIVEKENGKIISFPSEKTVFYALYYLKNNSFVIEDEYDIIKEPMEKLLEYGYIIDKQEILRDFDGWTWNIVPDEIENYIYNVVYQNIKLILGNEFFQNYLNNIALIDFIDEFEKQLKEKYDENISIDIYLLIYKISILEYIKNDAESQKKFVTLRDSLRNQLNLMENKKEYLQNISNEKKIIGKKIKQIDSILNDNKLLREKFIEENNKSIEKIFSLSEYSEILQERREELLNKLEEYSNQMKPMNYVKNKSNLNKKIQMLNVINLENNFDEQINNLLIELQINILNAFTSLIEKIENKKEIIKYIYWMRYYKLIYMNNKEQIKDVEELKKELNKAERCLITKACKLKAINILCQDIDKNFGLISKILSCNIIDLEDIIIEFEKINKKIILNIYEDKTITDSILYEENEEINVKLNKKIKLFN